MSFKKTIAGGLILASLAMPSYSKMYEKGMKTAKEKQYSVDLIGEFSDKEAGKISGIMKNLEEKIDRKKAGIESMTMRKRWAPEGYLALAESNNTILINKDILKKVGIENYSDIFNHEIGHLIWRNNEEKYYNKWSHFYILSDEENEYNPLNLPGCELKRGYVSEYPFTYKKGDLLNEDFAETARYFLNNMKYADKDKIVQEKIKVIKETVGK